MENISIPTYTIVFDAFRPDLLINLFQSGKNSDNKQWKYLAYIHNKGLVNYKEDSILDPWTELTFLKKNIFAESIDHSNLGLKVSRKKRSSSQRSADTEDFENGLKKLEIAEYLPDIDYRFTKIEVTPMDMNKIDIPSANEPLKAKLLGYGVIRLYRDEEDIGSESDYNTVNSDNTIVAILGVPFYFTASDLLLGFFDDKVRDAVSHFRLIRTQTPNRIMVLMKFRDAKRANIFVEDYNGRPFNSMEPEACQIVYVKQILFRPLKHEKLSTIPYLLDDPFTDTSSSKFSTQSPSLASTNLLQGSSTTARTSENIELPSCPVCLERLDSNITGLFTIPCQHTYHCQCLSKWKDDTCPICRYSSKFDVRRKRQEEQEEKCASCGTTDNLWICLICGNMGCGRYDAGHAIDHYDETSHCFAMETTSQRVWDYAGDNYVHRLVQNEADGKLVELPLRGQKGSSPIDSSSHEDKIEKLGFEYSKLLISQLESQREYFEMKYEELNNQTELASSGLSRLQESLTTLSTEMQRLQNENKELPKLREVGKAFSETKKLYQEEKLLNGALSEKIDFLTKENEELKAQNIDLQEQVNDVMFYLESQEKFKGASDDVKQGQVVIKQPTRSGKKKGRG